MSTAQWPSEIIVVRHGQSSGNVARDLAEKSNSSVIDIKDRDMDVALSDLGKRQAAALGVWFQEEMAKSPIQILVSPYIRARQTMEIATRSAVPYLIDERLREREFGLITGFTKRGIESEFPLEAKSYAHVKKFYYRPPGGESWCDVILRVRSVVESLSRDFVGDRVMIVAHTVVVHAFHYVIERLNEEQILKIDSENDIANCSITTFKTANTSQRPKLDLLNSIQHLTELQQPITRKPDVPKN